jgi:hypothetical protein
MVLTSGLGFETNTFVEITVLDDAIFSEKKLITSTKIPQQIEKLDMERKELSSGVSFYIFHFAPEYFHTFTIKNEAKTFVYKGF